MTLRAPDTSIREPLRQEHRRHRRALWWRCALEGAARCAVVLAVAVLLGVAFTPIVATAWVRLVMLLAACGLAVLAVATRFGRHALSLPAYLERVEQRFPDLKSLIRNAVDFEATTLENVSPELAVALRQDTVRRLHDVPLESLRPRVAPRRPAFTMLTAW